MHRIDLLVFEARPIPEAGRIWHPVRPMRITHKWLKEEADRSESAGGHGRPKEGDK